MATSDPLTSGFQEDGIWWLPEKPETRWTGRLSFDPHEGGVLEIIDDGNTIGFAPDELVEFSIMHGETLGGQPITLFRCIEVGATGRPGTLWKRRIRADAIFSGVAFQRLENVSFSVIGFTLRFLDEWANKASVRFERDSPSETGVKYALHPGFDAEIGPGLSIGLRFYSQQKFSKAGKEVALSHRAQFELQSEEPLTYERAREHIDKLADLLTLACHNRSTPLRVFGIPAVDGISFGKRIAPAEIFFALPPSKARERSVHRPRMLFGLSDIESEFENSLQVWLGAAEVLRAVRVLHNLAVHTPEVSIEQKFLLLTQALEAYHRRVLPGEYMPPERFENEVLEALLLAVPSNLETDFRKALGEKLKYLNEYSFRRRIRGLIRRQQQFMGKLFPMDATAVGLVTDLRNSLTHYEPGSEDILLDAKSVQKYNFALKALLQVNLLSHTGLGQERATECAIKNPTYSQEAKIYAGS